MIFHDFALSCGPRFTKKPRGTARLSSESQCIKNPTVRRTQTLISAGKSPLINEARYVYIQGPSKYLMEIETFFPIRCSIAITKTMYSLGRISFNPHIDVS